MRGKALCLAVVMAALTFAPGAAHAAETVMHVKTQRLSSRPDNGMPIAIATRHIRLDTGTYGWWHHVHPAAVSAQECTNYTGTIIGGDYTWTNQLWPSPPKWGVGWYRHDSILSGDGVAYQISCYFKIPVTGDYTWGSGLDPHF